MIAPGTAPAPSTIDPSAPPVVAPFQAPNPALRKAPSFMELFTRSVGELLQTKRCAAWPCLSINLSICRQVASASLKPGAEFSKLEKPGGPPGGSLDVRVLGPPPQAPNSHIYLGPSSFGRALKFNVITCPGLRNTRVGFIRNGTVRSKSVKIRNPKGAQSRKNPHGMSKNGDLGPRSPIRHASAYPRRTLNRTSERVYHADTSIPASQFGQWKSEPKTDLDTLNKIEHAGHATYSLLDIPWSLPADCRRPREISSIRFSRFQWVLQNCKT